MRFYWLAKEMEMEIEHSEGEKEDVYGLVYGYWNLTYMKIG